MRGARSITARPSIVVCRRVPDPFNRLSEREILPMLDSHRSLKPGEVLEEMERQRPDHDWAGYAGAWSRRVELAARAGRRRQS